MWNNLIDYLKGPLLVMKVQNFFGIIYRKRNKSENANIIHSNNEGEAECKLNKILSNTKTVASNAFEDDLICHIGNKFWYYLFLIGTEFGDEMFYALFIPSWFWNVDSVVGRRVVLVWAIVMYIGQGFKDVIQWPRPGYPVKKLQEKWSAEYGMPSTHAMVGVSIPFSVILYTIDRYSYSVPWAVVLAGSLCTLICVSRVYLGMHTVLDIIAGLLLSTALLVVLVPVVDRVDSFLLTSPLAPLVLIAVSVTSIIVYPQIEKWTPTRGDTTMIVSVSVGIIVGSWTNYQLGSMTPAAHAPPYNPTWPTAQILAFSLLRTFLGFCGIVIVRAFAKAVVNAIVCALLKKSKLELVHYKDNLDVRNKLFIECSSKYVVYFFIGVCLTYMFPRIFDMLKIGRPAYYTEIL